MRLSIYILIATLFFSVAFRQMVAYAHPGRTDSSGCHTCRTNCPSWGLSHGEYHCHRSKGITQPKEPIKSHLNKNGAGYVETAPEYKIPAKNVTSNNIKKIKQPEKIKDGWLKRLTRAFGI